MLLKHDDEGRLVLDSIDEVTERLSAITEALKSQAHLCSVWSNENYLTVEICSDCVLIDIRPEYALREAEGVYVNRVYSREGGVKDALTELLDSISVIELV